eukprot:Pgem_evm1s3624
MTSDTNYAIPTYNKTLKYTTTAPTSEQNRIKIYTDASQTDLPEGRTTISNMVTYHDNLVTYNTTRSKSTQHSSTKSEYVAASQGTKAGKYVQQIIQQLNGNKEPTTLQGLHLNTDNDKAKMIVNNETNMRSVHHIKISYHSIKEDVNNNTLM